MPIYKVSLLNNQDVFNFTIYAFGPQEAKQKAIGMAKWKGLEVKCHIKEQATEEEYMRYE